ncbi:hypothetical protein GGQ76_001147 [Aureimonas jatrophae]|nr:hypothetical protein [Aureimonas jatrophae]
MDMICVWMRHDDTVEPRHVCGKHLLPEIGTTVD